LTDEEKEDAGIAERGGRVEEGGMWCEMLCERVCETFCQRERRKEKIIKK